MLIGPYTFLKLSRDAEAQELTIDEGLVDAVADVHGVLRSVMFRTALWLRGVPVAAIEKGREEKKEFYPQRWP